MDTDAPAASDAASDAAVVNEFRAPAVELDAFVSSGDDPFWDAEVPGPGTAVFYEQPSTQVWKPLWPGRRFPLDYRPLVEVDACPERAVNLVRVAPEERQEASDWVQGMQAAGGARSLAGVEALHAACVAAGRSVVTVDRSHWPLAVTATLEAMEAGVDVIFGGCLQGDALDGRPPVLLKMSGEGERALYAPVVLKDHAPLDGETQMRPWSVTPVTGVGGRALEATAVLAKGRLGRSDAVQGAHYHRLLEVNDRSAGAFLGVWGRHLTGWVPPLPESVTSQEADPVPAENVVVLPRFDVLDLSPDAEAFKVTQRTERSAWEEAVKETKAARRAVTKHRKAWERTGEEDSEAAYRTALEVLAAAEAAEERSVPGDVRWAAGVMLDVIVWGRLDEPGAYTDPVSKRTLALSALEVHAALEGFLRDALDRARDRARGVTAEPELTRPAYSSTECGECPFRGVCLPRLEAEDDVTLLPGITPTRARAYRDRGVDAAGVLADVTLEEARELDRGGAWQVAQMVDQARVTRTGAVHRNRGIASVQVPDADIELDVDIENAEGDFVWLTGVLETSRFTRKGRSAERSRYVPYAVWSRSPDEEAEAFASFWAHVTRVSERARRTGRSWAIYVYSRHEAGMFKKLAHRHAGLPGVPSAADVDALVQGPNWVDLYALLPQQLVWPTRSHSLKKVATHPEVGFEWRDADPGGANSMAWWERAVSAECPVEERAALVSRNLEYNEDDVAATKALRSFLRRHDAGTGPGSALPSVEDLGGVATGTIVFDEVAGPVAA